jgi:hypothetical protein
VSAWTLIPCLVALRDEFNEVAPRRDKGADGAIGDSSHTSSSDHTPDEDSDVLRDHDADSKNEVHAIDIDCTGPWPDGRGGQADAWFDRKIRAIAVQERAEFQSATVYGRLQYIIWRGQIISRSWEWSQWRDYTGPSAHFDHAHFSARYLTRTEADTRSWDVAAAVPKPPAAPAPVQQEENLVTSQAEFNTFMDNYFKGAGRDVVASRLFSYDPGYNADGRTTPNGAIKNLTTDDPANPTVGAATALERAQVAAVLGYQTRDLAKTILDAVTAVLRNVMADDGDRAQVLAAIEASKAEILAAVVPEPPASA